TDLAGGSEEAHAVAIDANGKIVLAGFASPNGKYKFALARYDSTGPNAGKLDTTFNPNGAIPGTVVTTLPGALATEDAKANALLILPDGNIMAGSYLGTVFPEMAVLRYHGSGPGSGLLDNTFDGDGVVHTYIGGQPSTAEITDLALQPDGKIVAAGFGFDQGNFRMMLARFNPGGSLDTSF